MNNSLLRAVSGSFRFTLAVPLLLALGSGCSRPSPGLFQGYVEADYIHVGSPLGGTLRERPVQRGAEIGKGERLFTLENEAETAAVVEAEKRLAQTQARRDNLLKGRRPTEIAALEARVDQARANARLAEEEFDRRTRLARDQVIAPAEMDLVTSQRASTRAALASAEAELSTARLGGREDEINAAEAEVAAASAAVERARWSLNQKTQTAPVGSRVHQTLFEPGEFVPAGQPVVVLLPPGNLKLRFYVPESRVAECGVGTTIEYRHDGAAEWRPGTIRYVATQPEFTPPVIYSRESRTRLVFMVEAAPVAPADPPSPGLAPGLPIEVRLGNPAPVPPVTPAAKRP